ncbi:dihydrolipoyl dehydrogenase [Pontibacillus litoralis]|uniref:Dihydrolipoyl dehydrogenase n=1 Tax=Pontibacillus litoralis JSM 072002 TaxID=1385512 RepID=A0A0A5HTB7_9BACI|nr:dihydrolipoyl dehydrogenase [Pontibacillus litoralis]KGX86872.1 dihydrolipoamide dehydrogenase [Pontibacillus litoralis JSM 072002]
MVVGEIAEQKDVVVIGGGPGGYHAAIEAAQKGFTVTLIEKEKLGGVCLHDGCIPSKVFTTAARKKEEILRFHAFGIDHGEVTFQLSKLQQHKRKVIEQLQKGVEALCKTNKIEIVHGNASFLSADRIGVDNGHQFDVFHFNHAIVATGSTPIHRSGVSFDDEKVVHDGSIFLLSEIPEHLVVYGSHSIAIEVAMSYRQFGSMVTLIMADDKNTLPYDTTITRELLRQFKKQQIKVYTGVKEFRVNKEASHITAMFQHKGEQDTLDCTHVYVASDYVPNVKELGLSRLGIQQGSNGYIAVDAHMRTSLPSIYAIGDVTEGPRLAVKAIKQAEVVAATIAGEPSEFDPTFIPEVIHSIPPIATVGKTEQQAVEEQFDVKIGHFSYGANGYATIQGKKDGFIKLVINQNNDVVLGFHAIGEGAVELVSTGTLALEMAARVEDLTFPHYPHPAFSEALSGMEFSAVKGKVRLI